MLPLSVKQLMFLCHAAHSASLIFCIAHSLPVCVRLPPFVFFPLAVSFLPFRQSLSPPPSLLLSPPPSPHAASVPLPCCCRLCFAVLYCTFCPWKSREFEIVGWKEEAWRIMDRGGEIVVHAQLQIDTALPGRWRHFWLLPLWVSRLIFFPSSFGPKRKAQGTPHIYSSRLEVFSSEAQPGRPNTFQSRHTVGGREFRGMDGTFLSKRLHIKATSVSDMLNVLWLDFFSSCCGPTWSHAHWNSDIALMQWLLWCLSLHCLPTKHLMDVGFEEIAEKPRTHGW